MGPHLLLGLGLGGLLDEGLGLSALDPVLGRVEGLPLLLGGLHADRLVLLHAVGGEAAAAVGAGDEVVAGLGGEQRLAGLRAASGRGRWRLK